MLCCVVFFTIVSLLSITHDSLSKCIFSCSLHDDKLGYRKCSYDKFLSNENNHAKFVVMNGHMDTKMRQVHQDR